MLTNLRLWPALFLTAGCLVPSVTLWANTSSNPSPTFPPSVSVVLLTEPTATSDAYEAPQNDPNGAVCPLLTYAELWPQVQVTLAGEFYAQVDLNQVFSRLTSFKAYEKINYWSASRSEYRPLFQSSYGGTTVATSTTLSSVAAPYEIDFMQNDSGPVGAMAQVMKFCKASSNHIELAVHNKKAAKFFWTTVIPARAYRLRISITPIEGQPTRYRYRSVLRIAGSTRVTNPNLYASYGNRAVALFAYLTAQDIESFAPVTLAN